MRTRETAIEDRGVPTQDRLCMLFDVIRASPAVAADLDEVAPGTAIETAFLLGEARALCGLASWPALLREARISSSRAQSLLDLYRVSLKAQDILELGGVEDSCLWASKRNLPDDGEILAVKVGPWSTDEPSATCYVWPVAQGHCVGLMNPHDRHFQPRLTRTPVELAPLAWQCVWNLLGSSPAQMSFETIGDNNALLVGGVLERQRRALVREPRSSRL